MTCGLIQRDTLTYLFSEKRINRVLSFSLLSTTRLRKNKMRSILFIPVFILLLFAEAFAQQRPLPSPAPPAAKPAQGDTLKTVQIISAERYGFKKKDSLTELILMVGKVILKQENTTFYGD